MGCFIEKTAQPFFFKVCHTNGGFMDSNTPKRNTATS